MLYQIGIIIVFFLAFILITKPNKIEADKILFVWLLVVGLHLTLFYLLFSGNYIYYPKLLGISIPLPLMHGPLLYLYTASITNQSKNWKINFLHFIPALLIYVSLYNFFLSSDQSKILTFENEGKDFKTLTQLISILINLSGIVYFAWSLLLLKKHKKNISNHFSFSEKVNLTWLKYLIYGIGIIWLFVFFAHDEMIFGTVVLFVIFIGYFGINQAGIFNQNKSLKESEENIRINEIHQGVTKYEKSNLNEESALKIQEEMNLLMKNEELFKNHELTLDDLAEKLNVSSNHLSQVINSLENKTFYDYMNQYRIDKFCSVIENGENKKLTILAIALDCGFNSKSTFNRNFKNFKGITPSEFLKNLK